MLNAANKEQNKNQRDVLVWFRPFVKSPERSRWLNSIITELDNDDALACSRRWRVGRTTRQSAAARRRCNELSWLSNGRASSSPSGVRDRVARRLTGAPRSPAGRGRAARSRPCAPYGPSPAFSRSPASRRRDRPLKPGSPAARAPAGDLVARIVGLPGCIATFWNSRVETGGAESTPNQVKIAHRRAADGDQQVGAAHPLQHLPERVLVVPGNTERNRLGAEARTNAATANRGADDPVMSIASPGMTSSSPVASKQRAACA